MTDRMKKIHSWRIPMVVIAAILYVSASSINGAWIGIGNPREYSLSFESLKPFFASISLLGEKIDTTAPPAPTTQRTAPASSSDASVQASSSSSNASSSNKNAHPPSADGPRKTVNYSAPNYLGRSVSSTVYSGGSMSSASDAPDLAIQIVDTGILNGDAFVHATSVEPGQKGAVVFDIKNIGRTVSPEWNFSAKIPTPSADFMSETQPALAPGEGIRFTMGFSNLEHNGTNTISFIVDPNTKIANDPNRQNNTASATLFRDY